MKTIIISDMHNREAAVKNLFDKLGLMDSNGNRNEGFKVISLGDIVSLGYEEQEANYFQWVMSFIDLALIGNHEYPAINPNRNILFSGWDDRDRTAEHLVRESMTKSDKWQAATSVGKWLLTHAGLHPYYMDRFDDDILDAQSMANQIEELYESYRMNGFAQGEPDSLFDGISWNRGGTDDVGGIYWNDITDLDEAYAKQPNLVPQIVGHSSYAERLPNYPKFHSNLYCIDTKGSVNALVTEDDGETFEFVQSDIEYEYGHGRIPGKIKTRKIT